MTTIRLRDEQPWDEMTIPGSDRPVRIRRLHLDAETKATVSLVQFPPGWSRPGVGHYTCAEEFSVLSGELTVSGATHVPGDHVYIPPREIRFGSVTDIGCRALAFFSAPPRWVEGAPEEPADHPGRHGAPAGVLRVPRPGVQGGSELLSRELGSILTADADVLSLASAEWAWVPAGSAPPSLRPPLLLRSWS